MADIEIVVKIPDKEYKNICLMSKDGIGMALYDWIANGTPLPKGHGRLIDADAIEYTHAIARCLEDGHNWNELCVTENELYDTPTIIEADTESEE